MQVGSGYARRLPGVHLAYFDPLNLAGGQSPEEINRWREVRVSELLTLVSLTPPQSEVTHGRVAMLAAVGFLVGEARVRWGQRGVQEAPLRLLSVGAHSSALLGLPLAQLLPLLCHARFQRFNPLFDRSITGAGGWVGSGCERAVSLFLTIPPPLHTLQGPRSTTSSRVRHPVAPHQPLDGRTVLAGCWHQF